MILWCTGKKINVFIQFDLSYLFAGSFGGGQLLTFSGNGLISSLGKTEVTVCGQSCDIKSSSLLKIQCLTPHHKGTHILIYTVLHKISLL